MKSKESPPLLPSIGGKQCSIQKVVSAHLPIQNHILLFVKRVSSLLTEIIIHFIQWVSSPRLSSGDSFGSRGFPLLEGPAIPPVWSCLCGHKYGRQFLHNACRENLPVGIRSFTRSRAGWKGLVSRYLFYSLHYISPVDVLFKTSTEVYADRGRPSRLCGWSGCRHVQKRPFVKTVQVEREKYR